MARFKQEFSPDDSHGQPYSFDVADMSDWPEVLDWCRKELGGTGKMPESARWSHDGMGGIYLRDQIDATMFKMRWC